MINPNPPRGTRDFFPGDFRKREWLFNKWRNVSKSASFEEYDAPIMEHADLWNLKSGSDITKEMFCFEKENTQYCLRPEMTPSLTRMMISVYKSITLPARWFSIPQCWRYESTARGRKREFYQWNMDIFGATPIKSEIEILSIIIQFLESVNLTSDDVTIKISDRRLIEEILTSFGIPRQRLNESYNIIDKIPKLAKSDIYQMFNDIGVSAECVNKIFTIIETRDLSEIIQFESVPAYKEFAKIIQICKDINIWEWIEIDFLVIRGLDYYTGLVFEGFFKNSELKRAILGGGRYDNLMATYGAEPIPAIGFGMGDVVIMDVLEELKRVPETPKCVDYLVIGFNDSLMTGCYQITNQLRKINQLTVELYIGPSKIKMALNYGNRIGVKYAILIMPEEWANNEIMIRNMVTSKQEKVNIDIFYNNLKFKQLQQPVCSSVQGYSDSE